MHIACVARLRGKQGRDGGYSVHLPCPPKSKHCLKVEALIPPEYQHVTCPGVGLADAPNVNPDIYPGLSGGNCVIGPPRDNSISP